MCIYNIYIYTVYIYACAPCAHTHILYPAFWLARVTSRLRTRPSAAACAMCSFIALRRARWWGPWWAVCWRCWRRCSPAASAPWVVHRRCALALFLDGWRVAVRMHHVLVWWLYIYINIFHYIYIYMYICACCTCISVKRTHMHI